MLPLYNYQPFPSLGTTRLNLRPVLQKDQSLIFHLRSDPQLNQYILRKPMQGLKEARQFIEENENKVREGKLIHWTLEMKSSQMAIGNICLWNFSDDKKEAELGYSLLAAYQGGGLMGEAVNAVLSFGFEKLLLKQIEAYTQFNNEKSVALLKRAQFSQNPSKQDPYNDKNIVYVLERSRWDPS